MSRPGDFDYLLGTEVKLKQPSSSSTVTVVLDNKLSEEYQTFTAEELDNELGPPFAALKFSCHDILDPSQKGFIRLYYQIPFDGTISHPREVRAQQSLPHHIHDEVKALISLDGINCTAVPKLLGHGNELQGNGDYVPGGYINSVGWTRVAGQPIDYISYWKRDRAYRDEVRTAFRTAYEELKRGKWEPGLTPLRKLIYDEATKTMHISGFRGAGPLDPEPFSDVTYVIWGLAKPSRRVNWMKDSSKWKW